MYRKAINMKKNNVNLILILPFLVGITNLCYAQSLGDKKEGGIIYYIYQSGDQGYKEGETHGLIAAENNIKDYAKDSFSWEDAKGKCAALGVGWYLPNKDELYKLYKVKDKVGGFSSGIYCSSSEDDVGGAFFILFYDGFQGNNFDNLSFYVRAVRTF